RRSPPPAAECRCPLAREPGRRPRSPGSCAHQPARDGETMATVHRQLPAEILEPLAQSLQPVAELTGVRSDSVIPGHQRHLAVLTSQVDLQPGGVRMADRVGDGLLGETDEGDLLVLAEV